MRTAERQRTPTHRGAPREPRHGLTLVEVLVALTLLAIQVPMVVATVGAAAALTRRAEAVLASIDAPDLADRCERS